MIQLLLLAAFILPAILFLNTQYVVLKLIRPENRKMLPGRIWLQLIPFFGLVFQFFVISAISRSLVGETVAKDDDSIFGASALSETETGKRPTFWIGISYATLILAGGFINYSVLFLRENPGYIGPVFSFAGIICWIAYWVNLSEYRKKLKKGIALS